MKKSGENNPARSTPTAISATIVGMDPGDKVLVADLRDSKNDETRGSRKGISWAFWWALITCLTMVGGFCFGFLIGSGNTLGWF